MGCRGKSISNSGVDAIFSVTLVNSPLDPHVAGLAPSGAPTIADDLVVQCRSGIFAVADNIHFVIEPLTITALDVVLPINLNMLY